MAWLERLQYFLEGQADGFVQDVRNQISNFRMDYKTLGAVVGSVISWGMIGGLLCKQSERPLSELEMDCLKVAILQVLTFVSLYMGHIADFVSRRRKRQRNLKEKENYDALVCR